MSSARLIASRIFIALVALAVLVYAGDFISVRLRMRHPKPNDPFETVTAFRILAIPQKDGKTEFSVDVQQPQQTGVCVHSLFPQSGDPPCWYLKHKFAQPIPMTIFYFPNR